MISGVAVALPALGSDLAAGATALSLVETVFLAAAVALLLPAGRLADASDKATLYKLGMVTFALSSLLVGLVSSIPAILCLRFVQGITSAAVQAAGPAIIADAVPPERRGRAYGITIGAIYAGLTLGPICAGFLEFLSSTPLRSLRIRPASRRVLKCCDNVDLGSFKLPLDTKAEQFMAQSA